MARILIVDNYDSFTYNLVHLFRSTGEHAVEVVYNDRVDLSAVEQYQHVVLSPGPGIPSEAGQLLEVVRRAAGKVPLLGVCLGHQAIAEAFGGTLECLKQVYHGVASEVLLDADAGALFAGLPPRFQVGRYHSWAVAADGMPAPLRATATVAEGTCMALQHRELPVYGVQFHPESILTEHGRALAANFLRA